MRRRMVKSSCRQCKHSLLVFSPFRDKDMLRCEYDNLAADPLGLMASNARRATICESFRWKRGLRERRCKD